jgi:hypothetical protein
MPNPPQPSQLPLSWVGHDELPIVFVNQILVQSQPGEFVVAFGQVTTPPVIGTPEEQMEQLAQYDVVPIRTLVRMGITPARLREFTTALQVALDRHDEAMKGLDPR